MRQSYKLGNIHIFHWISTLLSGENKVPRTLFQVRKVAGSATCKQRKWYEIVLSSKITLLSTISLKCLPQNYTLHL